MQRFLILIILFILIQGCKPGIPKDIIQPDKMEKVLYDIHLVEGYLGTFSNKDTIKIVASSYYNGVYKKFGIDSSIYNKSMNYYYSHPVILDEMYVNLEKSFAKINEKYDKEVALIDSDVASNPSLVILANLPVANSPTNMQTNPFQFTLSLSRF